MRASFLTPLPETLAAWEAEDCPAVFVETRPEGSVWIVGTVETSWDGPATPRAVVRVRAVVPMLVDPDLPDSRWSAAADDGRTMAIREATLARRRSIRRCAGCDAPTPPELGSRMEGGFFCHGCMTQHFGVIF